MQIKIFLPQSLQGSLLTDVQIRNSVTKPKISK
jgi:hypothetical protein